MLVARSRVLDDVSQQSELPETCDVDKFPFLNYHFSHSGADSLPGCIHNSLIESCCVYLYLYQYIIQVQSTLVTFQGEAPYDLPETRCKSALHVSRANTQTVYSVVSGPKLNSSLFQSNFIIILTISEFALNNYLRENSILTNVSKLGLCQWL